MDENTYQLIKHSSILFIVGIISATTIFTVWSSQIATKLNIIIELLDGLK